MDRLEDAAFDRLLGWLDSDRERAGARYENLRRRLLLFFEARGCGPDAGELADRTFDTIERKLKRGSPIYVNAESYCYGVAKKLRLEYNHRPAAIPLAGDNLCGGSATELDEDEEKLKSCLEASLQALPAEDRHLILRFYDGQGRNRVQARKEQAAAAGISRNSLGIRAFRIRRELERRMKECLARNAAETKAYCGLYTIIPCYGEGDRALSAAQRRPLS